MTCIESVPNISEGRDTSVIEACARAVRTAGSCLLDVSSDPTHHRSVLTLAGNRDAVALAILALFDEAVRSIDLRRHSGEHPRIGAVDVVPFVPLAGVDMATCVSLARQVGETVANRHGIPVFLYEEAASAPTRRNLAEIRRGGFEGLSARLSQPGWKPDFGPTRPHPSAGATAIGARAPLIAFNVNLGTRDIGVARAIAKAIRTSAGGRPSLKAMGVDLAPRGVVQVSMNLTNFEQTSILDAYEAVAHEARKLGVTIVESELVGLAPSAALSAEIATHVHLGDFSDARILEHRLRACGCAIEGPVGMPPQS